jgi:integrase
MMEVHKALLNRKEAAHALSVGLSTLDKGRAIHLNMTARNAFLRLHSRTNGKEPMFKEVTNRWFEIVAKHAKLEDLRLHDLRHTFATRLANSGVPMTAIQHLLGHSDRRMTSRYAHATDATLIAAVAKLDSLSLVPVLPALALSATFAN